MGNPIWYYVANGSGYSPDGTLPPGAVECTQTQYEGDYVLVAGAITPVASPTAAQLLAASAQAAIGAGLAITSEATPALDGTYAVDATAQQHVMAEITSIVLNGTFADGSATVDWLDAAGGSHTFTIAQFKTFAAAISAYVAALIKCMNGQLTALPATSATIA